MSFAEEVLKTVSVPLSDELSEFLFLLLVREEKDNFPTLRNKYAPENYADIYAHSLNEHFSNLSGFCQIGLKFESKYILREYTPDVEQYWDSPYWQDIKSFKVPYRIPHYLRREHTYVIGRTGSGKSTLLHQLITSDAQTNASVIVIDSQGDLINELMRSTLIDPERLIIIDPRDSVEHPIALNMFDVDGNFSSQIEYEEHISGVVETLNFVFSSIMDASLTDKQSGLFGYCIRLLLVIPDATIHEFVDILENGIERYQVFIDSMSPQAQIFFKSAFPVGRKGSTYSRTKEEIKWRLDTLLEKPAISRIFKSPKNKLNLSKEMDRGKIILISTARGLLKPTGCAFFGRYFLAQISQAMQGRDSQPKHKRKATYVYVDECGDYLKTDDSNIKDILEKGRKYNVGITLAHQQLKQLPENVYHSIISQAAIKFIGSCVPIDLNKINTNLGTELVSPWKFNFDLLVDGWTGVFKIKTVRDYIEQWDFRTDEEMEAVMEANRAKYCVDYEIPKITPGIPVEESKSDEAKGVSEDPLAPYT